MISDEDDSFKRRLVQDGRTFDLIGKHPSPCCPPVFVNSDEGPEDEHALVKGHTLGRLHQQRCQSRWAPSTQTLPVYSISIHIVVHFSTYLLEFQDSAPFAVQAYHYALHL